MNKENIEQYRVRTYSGSRFFITIDEFKFLEQSSIPKSDLLIEGTDELGDYNYIPYHAVESIEAWTV